MVEHDNTGIRHVLYKESMQFLALTQGFLGLFAFGILTRRTIHDKLALYVCIAAPLLILGIDFVNNIQWYQKQLKLDGAWVQSVMELSQSLTGKFKIGYELLIYNGLFTFLGLFLISKKPAVTN